MRAAVFYATREGQALRVAERVASDLRRRHFETDVIDVRHAHQEVNWRDYTSVFLVASVHVGRHEQEMIEFVIRWKDELKHLHASFLSLTLSQAGAEQPSNTSAQRDAAHAEARQMIENFSKKTGWRPAHSLTVAGALAYSKYKVLVRWIMKRIARKEGFDAPADRDYDFTNWPAVDRFVDEQVLPV